MSARAKSSERSTPRAAGIDCGTNSIRLLVADVEAGRLSDLHREMRVVRLGQGVDRTGRIADEALERTRVALADYRTIIDELGAPPVRMVATSATRDAENRADFVAMVEEILGASPEIITGTEEAELSFTGAVAGLPGVQGDLLVADIGGGSTELVRGPAQPLRSFSMDVGCVRMTERHLHDDPPTRAQIDATVDDLQQALREAARHVPLGDGATLVGVAGTVTTIAAIALGLDRYDPDAIHGATIAAQQVEDVTELLLGMSHGERAALPVMHPGRVDVIGGGALVLRTLVRACGVGSLVASEHDILDGIVLSVAQG